jgi:hypothetical protein
VRGIEPPTFGSFSRLPDHSIAFDVLDSLFVLDDRIELAVFENQRFARNEIIAEITPLRVEDIEEGDS